MKKLNVLMVEDSKLFRLRYRQLLEHFYTLYEADSISSSLRHLEESKIDVVLLDLNITDAKGFELFDIIKAQYPHVSVVIVTSDNDVRLVVESLKRGAKNYIFKGDIEKQPDLIQVAIEDAFKQYAAVQVQRNIMLEQAQSQKNLYLPPTLEKLYDCATKATRGGLSLLVQGEPGVGKRTLVEFIHQQLFSRLPLVEIDGSDPDLSSKDLFGVEGGHIGRFELANNGVLFLDDVSLLSLELQKALLNVLRQGAVVRIGGDKEYHVDFQLLATTSKPLDLEIEKGYFLKDLYEEINQYPVSLPNLNQDSNLKMHFVQYFLDHYVDIFKATNVDKKLIINKLESHTLFGNLDELKTIIRTLIDRVSKGEESVIERYFEGKAQTDQKGLNEQLDQIEYNNVRNALIKSNGNLSEASRMLDIHRSTLQGKMRKFKMEPRDFK